MFARTAARSLARASRPALGNSLLNASRRSLAAGYVDSVTELIGTTPMVKLRRVVDGVDPSTKVLLKLEMQNPGGSVKDRIALSMIEEAEKRGEISPERTTIVEATSGNTGIGLAMVRSLPAVVPPAPLLRSRVHLILPSQVAAAKGYKCIIVMPQVPSMYERYILVRKFGCEVHLTSVMQDDFVCRSGLEPWPLHARRPC